MKESTIMLTFLVDNVADGDEARSSINHFDLCLGRSVDVYRKLSRSRFLCVYVEFVYNSKAYTLRCMF